MNNTAKVVRALIACCGEMTAKELSERTGIDLRAAQRALRAIRDDTSVASNMSRDDTSVATPVSQTTDTSPPLARVQAIPKKELNNYNNTTELASSGNPTADKNVAVVDLKVLAERLHEAAGNSINRTLGAFEAVAEPLAWIEAGADLEKDILPAVRSVAAQKRRKQIGCWGYFTDAVVERREKRLGIAAKFKPAPRGQDADLAEADRKLMEAGIDPSLAF